MSGLPSLVVFIPQIILKQGTFSAVETHLIVQAMDLVIIMSKLALMPSHFMAPQIPMGEIQKLSTTWPTLFWRLKGFNITNYVSRLNRAFNMLNVMSLLDPVSK